MFAVIEFDNNKKELAVVPLVWLSDDKKNCFWPNVFGQSALDKLIEDLTPPKNSWHTYSVKKIHDTGETFSSMNERLQLRIEEMTATTSTENEFISKQSTEENAEREDEDQNWSDSSENIERNKENCKRKKKILKGKSPKKFKINRQRNMVRSSSSEDSDWALPPDQTMIPSSSRFAHSASQIQARSSPKSSPSSSSLLVRTESPIFNPAQSKSSPGSSPSQPRTDTPVFNRNVQEVNRPKPTPGILNMCHDLTAVKLTLEQHSVMLQEILNTLRTTSIQSLTRPVDTPQFPIEHKNDFAAFETWLTVESNFMYMRTRVAAIGGSNVRSTAMNMLKFLMSNRMGMRFNWAGSAPKDGTKKRKQAFKLTKMYNLLNEAVKLAFSGRENADLSDYTISKAIQDWLKLSKSRYEHNLAPKEHLNN